jgi:hypothetical protein
MSFVSRGKLKQSECELVGFQEAWRECYTMNLGSNICYVNGTQYVSSQNSAHRRLLELSSKARDMDFFGAEYHRYSESLLSWSPSLNESEDRSTIAPEAFILPLFFSTWNCAILAACFLIKNDHFSSTLAVESNFLLHARKLISFLKRESSAIAAKHSSEAFICRSYTSRYPSRPLIQRMLETLS